MNPNRPTSGKRKLPSPPGRGAGGEGSLQLARARDLRTNSTEAEKRLWYYLRARRFMGLKFRRQQPIGSYIVDFLCLDLKLIIELDGGRHSEQGAYDRRRDTWLQNQGFRVLRFWNNQVLSETPAVLEAIRHEALALSPDPTDSRHPWRSPASRAPSASKSAILPICPGGRGELSYQVEE
ncbi:endonuclease domain-containing protein [Microbulbifer halophilus]|uniref:Endonuclease domain-containing protein n=1 Tax=Microbulbifer halophilus TaxID=453963 RepID=A0ABW5E8D4_9GAMM|nr:endonuclease domain-containing protein [Microbulbifer halophilus]MCW8125311.1 endonuclease domain-containing protein [Microbulbifer halophilus]